MVAIEVILPFLCWQVLLLLTCSGVSLVPFERPKSKNKWSEKKSTIESPRAIEGLRNSLHCLIIVVGDLRRQAIIHTSALFKLLCNSCCSWWSSSSFRLCRFFFSRAHVVIHPILRRQAPDNCWNLGRWSKLGEGGGVGRGGAGCGGVLPSPLRSAALFTRTQNRWGECRATAATIISLLSQEEEKSVKTCSVQSL